MQIESFANDCDRVSSQCRFHTSVFANARNHVWPVDPNSGALQRPWPEAWKTRKVSSTTHGECTLQSGKSEKGEGWRAGRPHQESRKLRLRTSVRSASEHQGTESWEKPAVPSEGEHKARGKADRARAGARGGKGQERELKERPRPRPWPGTKLRKKNAEEA